MRLENESFKNVFFWSDYVLIRHYSFVKIFVVASVGFTFMHSFLFPFFNASLAVN